MQMTRKSPIKGWRRCLSASLLRQSKSHMLTCSLQETGRASAASPHVNALPQWCTCHWGLCKGFPQSCGRSHFPHYIFFLAQTELYSFAFLTIYSKDLTAFIFFTKAQIGSLTGFNNSHSSDVKSGVSYKCTMLLWCSFIDQRANKSKAGNQGCTAATLVKCPGLILGDFSTYFGEIPHERKELLWK